MFLELFRKLFRKISIACQFLLNPKLLFFRTWLEIRLIFQSLTVTLLAPKKLSFSNIEKIQKFDFYLAISNDKKGVSALLRVKNEETKILYCLKSIINVFDEIVLVDNGSQDETMNIVNDYIQRFDSKGKIQVYSYPYQISCLGVEDLNTAENSVHSLTYFTNWAMSHCSYSHVCRWDADMVLCKTKHYEFKEFLRKDVVQGEKRKHFIGGQTVYKSLCEKLFLSLEINSEPRIFPFGYCNRFFKAGDFERFRCAPEIPIGGISGCIFYELKFCDEDEFPHYNKQALGNLYKNMIRIEQEWSTYLAFREGRIPSNLIPLESTFLEQQVLYPEGFTPKHS